MGLRRGALARDGLGWAMRLGAKALGRRSAKRGLACAVRVSFKKLLRLRGVFFGGVWGVVRAWVERRGGGGLERVGSLAWRGGWVRWDCARRWVPSFDELRKGRFDRLRAGSADAGMAGGRGAVVEGCRGEGRGRSRRHGIREGHGRASGRGWRKAGRRECVDRFRRNASRLARRGGKQAGDMGLGRYILLR